MKKTIVLSLSLFLIFSISLLAQTAKLPAERAGKIESPFGKIAFIRSGDLWAMDWDGKNQFKVVTAQNADGSLSWSPDDKRIAFPRKGSVDLRSPDQLGGQHKIYDIFIAYVDTARIAGKTNWWMMLTNQVGSRYPKWSKDGSRIIFTHDINANFVNSSGPNYQTAWADTVTGNVNIFRTDYNNNDSLSVLMPSPGPDNKCVFIVYKGFKPLGMAISALDKKTLTQAELGTSIKLLTGVTAPAWSPDGKWIAFVDTDMSRQGIYITNPDLSEKFLVFKPAPGQSMQTYPLSWSPDSQWITFATSDGSIWIIDITGNGIKQLTGAGLNMAPAWSNNK